MARDGSDRKPEGLTRRDFAHATVKAGVAAGVAIWVAPQMSSYALAQSTGSSPPSPAGARRGGEGEDSRSPAADDTSPRDTDPTRPPGAADDPSARDTNSTRRRGAADPVVGDPRFTG